MNMHLPPYDPAMVAARRAELQVDVPWDQGERDEHGYDHRAPMLVRALERNRDALAHTESPDPAYGSTDPPPPTTGDGAADCPQVAGGQGRDLPPRDACHHWSDPGGYCGATDNVTRYLPGLRCPRHTPAAIAGHPAPVPDPAATLDGLRGAARDRQVEAAKRRTPMPSST